jgi:hypothetical protein
MVLTMYQEAMPWGQRGGALCDAIGKFGEGGRQGTHGMAYYN